MKRFTFITILLILGSIAFQSCDEDVHIQDLQKFETAIPPIEVIKIQTLQSCEIIETIKYDEHDYIIWYNRVSGYSGRTMIHSASCRKCNKQ